MPPASKRKRRVETSKPLTSGDVLPPPSKRHSSVRNAATASAALYPDVSEQVLDAPEALRASPGHDVSENTTPGHVWLENATRSDSPLSDVPDLAEPPKKTGRGRKSATKTAESANPVQAKKRATNGATKDEVDPGKRTTKNKTPALTKESVNEVDGEPADPEVEEREEADEVELADALSRPPPVHSGYLPLPWKGRLGYACLNTYLRTSNPPVFSSRTCRIQSILEHRHPLQAPSQPEHPTKNRPDKDKAADQGLGQRYIEKLCLANVHDIVKMVRWNDRYNIKFFRLSSEMFPFASHPEYGYTLAPFASEALEQAGKVIAELGHRVTTHPGQFTQLGSPRKSVIENAIRDLEYHNEMLSLLKLPEQQNRDAVMVLHLGGTFEGKEATIQRFKENYAGLSQGIKNRLVLENDDVSWSVHDLLPVCEELDIPMVLDFHHHNILFDTDKIREGTKDIMKLFPRIQATWDRKRIKQKMHYSEPTPAAITPRQRRKHSPRVATLPPCPPDVDLMIEAKDKEQAVFELMRNFKLPGYEKINDLLPFTRTDDNKTALAALNKKIKKKEVSYPEAVAPALVSDDDVGMGGSEGRVYWPPTMEEWLRPQKREVQKKDRAEPTTAPKKKLAAREAQKSHSKQGRHASTAASTSGPTDDSDPDATVATKKAKAALRKKLSVPPGPEKSRTAPSEQDAGAPIEKPKRKPGVRTQKARSRTLPSKPNDEPQNQDEASQDPFRPDLGPDHDNVGTVVALNGQMERTNKSGERKQRRSRAVKGKVNYTEQEDGV